MKKLYFFKKNKIWNSFFLKIYIMSIQQSKYFFSKILSKIVLFWEISWSCSLSLMVVGWVEKKNLQNCTSESIESFVIMFPYLLCNISENYPSKNGAGSYFSTLCLHWLFIWLLNLIHTELYQTVSLFIWQKMYS